MKTCCRLLVMTSLAILAAGTVCAGTNEWSNIGPGSAGVALLAFDPHDSGTIYAAAGTGVFKSTDGGSTWSNTGLLGWGVNNLLIHPQNSSVLYAQAAFSPDDNTDITKIFKSTDGGATWNDMVTNARLMALDPQDANTVYALAGGYPQGLFNSTDGGGNWARLDGIPANLVPVGLAIDPQNPATLYAPVQGNSAGRTVATIFKSTDGGASWRESVAGLPPTFVPDNGVPNALVFAPGGLTVDPKNPGTLYATKFLTGVYKSTDGGATWRAANFGMPNNPNDFPPCCSFGVVIDPQNPNTLYTPGGNPTNLIIYKSTNGGLSWSAITSLGAVGFTPLTIDPQGALYTTGGGLRKSADGGATWGPLNFSLRATPVSSLAIDPQNSGTFYAGNFKSTDGGMSWYTATFGIGQGYPIAALAIDPQTPATLYAGTGDADCEYADLAGVYKSVDGGMNWVDTHAGAGCVSGIAVDPENPATVYAVGTYKGISKSLDGGISWSAANSGLPAGRLNALAIDPKNSGAVYAASYSGLFQSKDGGATWSNAGLTSEVYAVAIDPQNTGTLYAATASGLFQSADGGATWSNGGLMSGTYAVAVDPQAGGTIYAGTDNGVFQSTGGGGAWALIAGGPDHARLLALDPRDPNTVYAGGPGGLFTITLGPAIPAARPSAATLSPLDRRESGRIPER